MDKSLRKEDIERFQKAFEADPRNTLAMNAVSRSDIAEVSLSRRATTKVVHTYSHFIRTGTASAQGATGRCWIFAAMNTFRIYSMERLNLKDFEFSQSYLMFWDKVEKGNFFLENIIETRKEPLDGRLVMWLLSNIVPDAGQWDMLVNLVKKYGVVPKTVMPETKSSMASRSMNGRLIEKLREYAKELREMDEGGASLSVADDFLNQLVGIGLSMLPPYPEVTVKVRVETCPWEIGNLTQQEGGQCQLPPPPSSACSQKILRQASDQRDSQDHLMEDEPSIRIEVEKERDHAQDPAGEED